MHAEKPISLEKDIEKRNKKNYIFKYPVVDTKKDEKLREALMVRNGINSGVLVGVVWVTLKLFYQ